MDSNFKQPTVNYDDAQISSRASRRRLGPTALQLVPPDVANEKNKRPPSYYFKNNFYWTIETEEPELVEAIDFLGADRFFFATDYPHDDPGGRMKFKDVELLAVNANISESDKDLIRFGNARRVFKIT
jgi:predicted TIM-barrel fold metal-dependent hydrolase